MSAVLAKVFHAADCKSVDLNLRGGVKRFDSSTFDNQVNLPREPMGEPKH